MVISRAGSQPGKLLAGGWPCHCADLAGSDESSVRGEDGRCWAGASEEAASRLIGLGDLVSVTTSSMSRSGAYSITSKLFRRQLLGIGMAAPLRDTFRHTAFCGGRIRVFKPGEVGAEQGGNQSRQWHRGSPWRFGDRIGVAGPPACAMASLMARTAGALQAFCRAAADGFEIVGRQA